MNTMIYLWQAFIYGVLGMRPSIDFSEIPKQFSFSSHYDEENKVYWVEAYNLPEFIVSGKTPEELAKNFVDTILVYFDVPRYFAKKYKGGEFKFTNPKTGEAQTVQLNKEELSRVLA